MKYCQIGLLREHHPPDRQILSSLQPIQLDSVRNAATDCVPTVPDRAVAAGRLTVVDQTTDLLAEDIVDHEPNIQHPGNLVTNDRAQVERVRIVPLEFKDIGRLRIDNHIDLTPLFVPVSELESGTNRGVFYVEEAVFSRAAHRSAAGS